ncbi:KAP family P-loop NTPase fold protein [Sedimenticola thiotaurini]|uniref:NTPase n=1 Tax=Sedimenticola thiotaurini TaxID=1543721 RepID=A0A0F7JU21_9GAMM|nr:KAP family NTPase [Sedimenticola thiotaurini]AKH20051.1 NTPase [Sedimenticola thiotaurini]
MDSEKYSSDSPVRTVSEDRFSRSTFSARVANVISERQEPSSITIGLYGPWGDGKTSVLNFIEESIKENGSAITVRFNPWLFGSVESLLLGFFDVLADALDAKLITQGEKFKDILKKTAPGIASVAGAKGLGEAVGAFLHGPDIIELRNRIEKELEDSQKRILVIIDDVDRLEKSEIQALFKLVKLVADFRFTAYILAFDKDIVASSLSENYSGANGKSGEQFLEKIIQVPLHLPAVPAKDLRQFCFQGVDEALSTSGVELSEQQVQEFVRHFTLAFDENLTTPRKAKLYGNILMFSLPILKGEVNPVDLMLLEGLRTFAPELYEIVRKNKDSFVGTFHDSYHHNAEPEKQRIKDLIDGVLTKTGKVTSGYIELLKNMFPKLQAVYGNMHYGSDWYQKWNDGQRICAEGYFDRYFTYAVPKGDFPDAAISLLINTIEGTGGEISAESNPLHDVLTSDNSRVLIRKLRNRANSLNALQSTYLSLAVCQLASEYPNPESMFGWDDPHTQAAMLVSDLVQKLEKKNRVDHVVRCIRQTTTSAFQLEIFKWLRKEEDDKPEKDAFSTEEVAEIGLELADCLDNHLKSVNDITSGEKRILPHTFYILNQYSKKESIIKHISSILEKDKSAIVRLLDAYTPTAWGMETGISHKSDFERDQYNSLIRIFDPGYILKSIESFLGNIPDDQENYPRDFERNDRSIVLHQFVWIHRRVLLEKDEQKA